MSREARRAAFIDAAAALVEEGGVAAVSFEALAEASSVAKTLPYAYFASVDEILVDLFDRVVGGIDRRIETILLSGEPFGAVVGGALGVWFDAVRDHGVLVSALLDGRSHPALVAATRRRDRDSHKRWHDLVAAELGLVDPEAHLLAAMLTSTATATVQLWAARRGSRAALVAGVVAMAQGAAEALGGHQRRRRR